MSETAENLKILICTGTGGFASGAADVVAAFEEEFKKKGVAAKIGSACQVNSTGCRGLCANDVLVDVCLPGKDPVTYDFVTAELVPQIVDEHILGEGPIAKKVAGPYYNKFLEKQQRIIFSRCGVIDAES
ncbi:MAG: (2Fe-2S) ferredoxin domain-containing protein, partial [Chloroflexi bacterium]|nr:(2Fe-2S) ferredoxin domain-containing protein [Chloroflexota bacterium]